MTTFLNDYLVIQLVPTMPFMFLAVARLRRFGRARRGTRSQSTRATAVPPPNNPAE